MSETLRMLVCHDDDVTLVTESKARGYAQVIADAELCTVFVCDTLTQEPLFQVDPVPEGDRDAYLAGLTDDELETQTEAEIKFYFM